MRNGPMCFYSVVRSAGFGRWDQLQPLPSRFVDRSPPPPSPRSPSRTPAGGQIVSVTRYSPPRRRPTAPSAVDGQFDGPDWSKSGTNMLEREKASNVRKIQKLKSEIWRLKREKRKEQRKEENGEKRVRWRSRERSDPDA